MSRHPLALVVALSLAACAPTAEPSVDPALENALTDTEQWEPVAPGVRRNLVLTVSRLVPGDTFTLTVAGASPGEQVTFARSTTGAGSGPCFGTSSLACLGILNPALQGQATADATGTATLTQTLPEFVTIGADVSFQAVVPRGASGASWLLSTPVEVFVEDADLPVGDMVAGDLILTEVMQNPAAVSDGSGEWFEVRNTTGLDMNLAGLEVTDFQGDTFTVGTNLFLAAGDHLVLGRNADEATNGGVAVDHEYTNMDLGNGFDEIHLLSGTTILDSVAWDDGQTFPDTAGASMELDWTHLDHLANDAGVSWAEGTRPYGAGDLGTPGEGPTPPGRWLYTVDETNDELERVDLDTMTWETIGALGTPVTYGDLAYDLSTDTLYLLDGVASHSLWTVDRATGAATLVGPTGVSDLSGLEYDPATDTLYGSAWSFGDLYTVDPATGAATHVGNFGVGVDTMAPDPDSDDLIIMSCGGSWIHSLDPVSLQTTLLATLPYTFACGLAYDEPADLYWTMGGGGELYSYDPDAGWGRVLEDTRPSSYTGLVRVPFAE